MNNGEHKNQNDDSVRTHGIDFLYSYMNPLVDGQLKNVIISSKYSTSKYPNSPTQQFKWFMTDLINTMECFDNSDIKSEILEPFSCAQFFEVYVALSLKSIATTSDGKIYMRVGDFINPKMVAKSKANVKTTLKNIEPYALKALIVGDLKMHPQSLMSEIAERLPAVELTDFRNLRTITALKCSVIISAANNDQL